MANNKISLFISKFLWAWAETKKKLNIKTKLLYYI